MARTVRQSKILEIIASREVETQEELARELARANFEITQATISRDIKELGLIKVLSATGKYKYAFIDSSEQAISPKFTSILREVAISVRPACNLIVVKVMRGAGPLASSAIDKLSLDGVLGLTFGDEYVFIATPSERDALTIADKLSKILLES